MDEEKPPVGTMNIMPISKEMVPGVFELPNNVSPTASPGNVLSIKSIKGIITYWAISIGLIVLISAIVVLSFQVSELKEDKEILKETNDAYSTQIIMLKIENTNIRDDLIPLTIENEKLISENEDYQSEIAELQSTNDELETENEEFKKWLIIRGGLNPEEYGKMFLTPDDETVIYQMKEILGGDADGELTWNDMRDIDKWVHDNVDYNFDTPLAFPKLTGDLSRDECWLFPNETLKELRGDCEDQTFLTLSLFFSEEKVPWAWIAGITYEDGSRHMIVILNVEDDQMYILDPTNGYSQYLSDPELEEIEDYGDFCGKDVKNIDFIFNMDNYFEFDSLQKFYDYF